MANRAVAGSPRIEAEQRQDLGADVGDLHNKEPSLVYLASPGLDWEAHAVAPRASECLGCNGTRQRSSGWLAEPALMSDSNRPGLCGARS